MDKAKRRSKLESNTVTSRHVARFEGLDEGTRAKFHDLALLGIQHGSLTQGQIAEAFPNVAVGDETFTSSAALKEADEAPQACLQGSKAVQNCRARQGTSVSQNPLRCSAN